MSTWNLGQNDPPEEYIVMKNQLASKESQIASYQTQLMRKSNEFDELKKTFEESIHKLTHETKRALELEGNLLQRDAEFANEKLFRQNLETALNGATKDRKDSDLEIRTLQSILDAVTQESRTQQERDVQLQKEKLTLQERVKELQLQISQPASNEPANRNSKHRPRSSSLSNFRVTSLEQDLRETKATMQKREGELQAANEKLSSARAEAIRIGNEKVAIERNMSSRIRELEASLEEKEEELRCLEDQAGNSHREQELLERIDEDEAKISALESMLRDNSPPAKLQKAEQLLEEERRNVQRLTQLHSEMKEEKENLLHELKAAHDEINTRRRDMETMSDQPTTYSDPDSIARAPFMPGDPDLDAYVERLLAAVDRLRNERDDLKRDVQFLESESRFAIEALEAKLSASTATSISTNETIGTLAQLKAEMDALYLELSQTKELAKCNLEIKTQEISRLGRLAVVLGATVSHLPLGESYSEPGHQDPEYVAEFEANFKALEEKLDVTVLCLEATSSQREDLVVTLREKEAAWAAEVETIRFGQQQATRTIEDLAGQINDLTNQLEEVESQRNSLTVQIENLENDLDHARNELNKAESRYSDLQFNQLNSMSSTEATASLRTQIRELEMRILRRNEQIGLHQHDIRRLETNLRLQEDRISEMTTENEMLNAQKDAMIEDCANTREERDVALHRAEELEEEIVNLEANQAGNEVAVHALIGVIFETAGKAKEAIHVQATAVRGQTSTSLQRALLLAEEMQAEKVRMEADSETYQQRVAELESQISVLRSAHESDVARNAALQEDLDQQSDQFQHEIATLQKEGEELRNAHLATVEKLETEIDRLQQQLATVEKTIILQNDQTPPHQPEGRDLVALETRIAELDQQLSKSEAAYKSTRDDLEKRLCEALKTKGSTDLLLQDTQRQLTAAQERHETEIAQLQESMNREAEQASQLLLSRDSLKRENEELSTKLDIADKKLLSLQGEFEGDRQELTLRAQDLQTEREQISIRMKELADQVTNEREHRTQEQQEYRKALQASNQTIRQHEESVRHLESDLAGMKAEFDRLKQLQSLSEEEKARLQEQTTTLLSKVEQNRSVQRVLEDQINDREQTINSLKSELSRVQEDLSRVEQVSARASLNMSLVSAQHKREMADLQRELQNLRSKSNLEQVVAELEEQNREMDDLLKQKCTEIEENDDRQLEMLKENKKLTSKVETLTRKMHTLQTKMVALKSKQEESKPAQPSMAVEDKPRPEPAFQRPRSIAPSISQPTFSAPPSASSSKPILRAASSFSLQPEIPEIRSPMPVFKNRTPERPHSEIDFTTTSSVIGKKRRAPDDFEGCESVPPQVFTADSVPGHDTEDRTPRVRRMLSSLQSGFTPIRNAARPIPVSSSKANQAPSQSSPFISDVTNSPLVVPPLHSGLQSAKSKRSWLGKIRGASTSTPTNNQGMSRMQ